MLLDDDLEENLVRSDEETSRSRRVQDHRWLMVSGVAALAMLVLLVVAVLYTARSATQPREAPSTTVPLTPSTPAAVTSMPTTTSYLPPRVQTSEATTIAPEPIAPIETAPAEPTHETPPPAPTTIFNPYLTTSVPNAGAF